MKKKSAALEEFRKELKDDKNLTIGFGQSSCPGCTTIEIRHARCPHPIAIVWFSFRDNNLSIDILNSFVFSDYRRCGLRTRLNEALFRSYPCVQRITTGAGTDDGEKWMKAVGYKKSPRGWEISRAKKRAR